MPAPDASVYLAALRRARDLAGGVSFLSGKTGFNAETLDAMLHGREEIPGWVFLRVWDYINDAEAEALRRLVADRPDQPATT